MDTMNYFLRSNKKGFTLVELQVAIFLLLMSISGITGVLVNYLKQVEYLEGRNRVNTSVFSSPMRVVYSEVRKGIEGANYDVYVKSFQEVDDTLMAYVTLTEKKSEKDDF